MQNKHARLFSYEQKEPPIYDILNNIRKCRQTSGQSKQRCRMRNPCFSWEWRDIWKTRTACTKPLKFIQLKTRSSTSVSASNYNIKPNQLTGSSACSYGSSQLGFIFFPKREMELGERDHCNTVNTRVRNPSDVCTQLASYSKEEKERPDKEMKLSISWRYLKPSQRRESGFHSIR